MSQLFRREVVENKQRQLEGDKLIISPPSFKVIAWLVSAILSAIIIFFCFGTYTNKQTVEGYILPSKGLVTVDAPQRGTVVERYVRLGDRVHKEQKLYLILLSRSTPGTKNLNAALLAKFGAQKQAIERQLELAENIEQSRLDQLRNQQQDLRSETIKLEKQLETERSILTLNRKNLSRYKLLAKTGLVSKIDLTRQQQEALTQLATVEQLEKSLAELGSEMHQIPGEISQTKFEAASDIENLKDRVAQLEQQQLQLQGTQQIVVLSPVNGTVSSVMTEVGQAVTDGAPLVSILPAGSVLQARLLVPSRAIGFVHPGELVHLRYVAFPYEQFGSYRGRVLEVSRSIIVQGQLDLPVNLQEPFYLVATSLDRPYVLAHGRRMQLAAGMTLSADIVLDRERLYTWILEPLKSLN